MVETKARTGRQKKNPEYNYMPLCVSAYGSLKGLCYERNIFFQDYNNKY